MCDPEGLGGRSCRGWTTPRWALGGGQGLCWLHTHLLAKACLPAPAPSRRPESLQDGTPGGVDTGEDRALLLGCEGTVLNRAPDPLPSRSGWAVTLCGVY